MESTIYNQDLCKYICGFLETDDILIFTVTDREIRRLTKNMLPIFYGKFKQLRELKEKYSFDVLQRIVKTEQQATFLFVTFKCGRKDPFYKCYPYIGFMKKIYNIMKKEKATPASKKEYKRILNKRDYRKWKKKEDMNKEYRNREKYLKVHHKIMKGMRMYTTDSP